MHVEGVGCVHVWRGGLLAHDNDGFVACRFLTIDHKLIQVYNRFRCWRSPILIPRLAMKHSQHVTVAASLNTICVCGWRCVGGGIMTANKRISKTGHH